MEWLSEKAKAKFIPLDEFNAQFQCGDHRRTPHWRQAYPGRKPGARVSFGGTVDAPLSGADGDPEGAFRIRSGRPGRHRADEASYDPWDAVDEAIDAGLDPVNAQWLESARASAKNLRRSGETRAVSQQEAKRRYEETRGSRAAYMREYRKRKRAAV